MSANFSLQRPLMLTRVSTVTQARISAAHPVTYPIKVDTGIHCVEEDTKSRTLENVFTKENPKKKVIPCSDRS